jgi:hypothetical protein
VTWDRALGSWDRRPRRRSAARDAFRRRDIGRGTLGSALMSRVTSDTGAPAGRVHAPKPEAGAWRRYAVGPRFNDDPEPTRTGDRPDPTRGEAHSPDAGRTGSQPTESEFEEITADTLLGPHFVRTWPYGAGPTREVGTVRGTRAREVRIKRGKLGSSGPANAGSAGCPTSAWDQNAGSWDHPARAAGRSAGVPRQSGMGRTEVGIKAPG